MIVRTLEPALLPERLVLCERLAARAAELVGVPAPETRLRSTRAGGKAWGSSRRPVVIIDAAQVDRAPSGALANLVAHEVGHLRVPSWRRRLMGWGPLAAVAAVCAAVSGLAAAGDRSLALAVGLIAVPVLGGLMLMLGPWLLREEERRADGIARWLVGPTVFEAGLSWQSETYDGPEGRTRRSDWHLRPADRAGLARGPAATDPGPLLKVLAGAEDQGR